MIVKKPKKTEEEFLRGSSRASGSNGSGGNRPRIPDDLYERLRDIAWERRVTINTLIVEILERSVAYHNRKENA